MPNFFVNFRETYWWKHKTLYTFLKQNKVLYKDLKNFFHSNTLKIIPTHLTTYREKNMFFGKNLKLWGTLMLWWTKKYAWKKFFLLFYKSIIITLSPCKHFFEKNVEEVVFLGLLKKSVVFSFFSKKKAKSTIWKAKNLNGN